MSLIDDVRLFEPENDQETVDQRFILQRLECDPHVLERSSMAHVTCSAWAVDPTYSQVLFVYHRIYDSWSWVGGHADGQQDLVKVALRELEEETGAGAAKVVPYGRSGILSLEVLTVDGHEKRGEYVGSHLHLNVTYLVQADSSAPLRVKADENSGVRWASFDEALALSSEPWIRDRIYRKLIDKTRAFGTACRG